ncbi:DUF624 domain-containing protein [Erysipelothrix urinaevulpis]|uniref:DUF624 domain-containing protein n=1 Tax=Erysipelothrix urinaevulpis TaxID=2683717 RepID=UPI001359EBE0
MEHELGLKFYSFSVALWDILLSNAMFLLFNIFIPFAFISLKTKNILVLIILMIIFSLNLIPSFIAMQYALNKKINQDQSIIKLFLVGYKNSYRNCLKANLFFVISFYLFYLDYLYFSSRNLQSVALLFVILMIVEAYFVMAFCTIQSKFNFSFKDTIQLSIMYIMKLTKPMMLSLGFLLGFLLLVKNGAWMTLFFMFALVARINNKQSEQVCDEIYRFHTKEGLLVNE